MKKIIFIIVVGIVLIMSSCVSSKPYCPAYASINNNIEDNQES